MSPLRSLGLVALLASTAALAEALPSLPRGTDYGRARDRLIGQGWRPERLPGADSCPVGDARCAGRPEMVSCSGSGQAPCLFAWRRGGTVIEVSTLGEDAPRVSGIRCRSGCR